MITHGNEIKLFSGNSNRALAEGIARKLNTELGAMEVNRFSNGEINVHFEETVRGRDLFLIQSTSEPCNDYLMELLIMIDAAKRASAGRITAVMPYFGYARQDRKARSREPITAKLVADLLTAAGADRILTMDLHAAQIQGFFNIPVDNLLGGPILYNYFKAQGKIDDEFIVVSPDVGSVARARKVATRLDVNMAIIDKRRPKANVMEVMNIIGDVKGKKCLMVDRAGAQGRGCEGNLRLRHACGALRTRDRAAAKLADHGARHERHHPAAFGETAPDDEDRLRRGHLCRRDRERLSRQTDVENLRLIQKREEERRRFSFSLLS